MSHPAYTPAYENQGIPCPLCGETLELRPTRGRKSGKPSLMFICPVNGKHFRGFINDQDYVRKVLDLLEDSPREDDPS